MAPRRLDRRTIAICVVIAALGASVAALIALAVLSPDDDESTSGALELTATGDIDTDRLLSVQLDTRDGGRTDLDAFLEGRPLLVNFWQSTCVPCIEEMPLLEAVSTSRDDLDVMGIASQDQPTQAEELAAQTGVTYPWVLDPEGNAFFEAAGAGMPTSVLLDADGRVLATETGAFADADELAGFLDEHLPGLMLDAPLALAFTAGMVATVNPCGFAMLPAYLSFFLGIGTGPDESAQAGLARALLVGATVSAGFLALFAGAGVLIELTTVNVEEFSPWLTIVIGAALAIGGVAFLAGWEPKLAVPRLDKGGRTRGLGSMFVFGLSYAVASLSCTIGPFTSVVANTFRRSSVASGLASFIAYGMGMALLLIALTVTLALARQGLLSKLRQALPYVARASGLIMLVMGAYLVWYGIYEIRLVAQGNQDATSGPVGQVTAWSSDISNWLTGFDPLQVALVGGIVICSVVLVLLLRTPRPPQHPESVAPAGDARQRDV